MKKIVIIALAFFTINGMAQQRQNRKEFSKKRHELRKAMTPEDVANLKSKKMTLQLNLSEKQQKEVYDIVLAQAEERQTEMKKRQAKKESDAKPTKDEIIAYQNKKLDKQIAFKRKMKSILNTEQYNRFEKLVHKFKKKRRGKRARKK